jgi:chromosomal replication initiation ATPase DnaA
MSIQLSEPKTIAEMRAAHLARQARLSPTVAVVCPDKTLLHLTIGEHSLIIRMRESGKISQIHPKRIVEEVSDLYGISVADMLSARTTRRAVEPRQIAYYLCRKLTTRSLEDIGHHLGRSRGAAFKGFNRITDRRKHDPELNDELTWLEGQLAG